MPDGLNSNLNLNQGAPPRVRPVMGEWGPVNVPNTRAKRRGRWFAIGALVLALAVLVGYAYLMYTLMQ